MAVNKKKFHRLMGLRWQKKTEWGLKEERLSIAKEGYNSNSFMLPKEREIRDGREGLTQRMRCGSMRQMERWKLTDRRSG